MIDPSEQVERMAAVQNAIATQRLAGLEIDEITKADLMRVADGEMNIDEVRAKVMRRIANGEFRDHL